MLKDSKLSTCKDFLCSMSPRVKQFTRRVA
jgi:hypothetical protein